MSFETIRVETDERGVARLTLTRPEKHNAMSIGMIRELREAVATLGADASVRAVVLTGEGESFCAGGDLGWMHSILGQSRAERVAESGELASALYELNRLPKPVIGRIQGPAYGGGLGLVACCDVAIASRKAMFSLTEVTLGLVPANIAPYVARKMGEAHARATFFTGRRFDAEEAARRNLVDRAVDPEALDDAIEGELRGVLRCAPAAVAATKDLVEFVLTHGDADNRRHTADRLADAWETADGQEGITAFFEKRPPSWRKGST